MRRREYSASVYLVDGDDKVQDGHNLIVEATSRAEATRELRRTAWQMFCLDHGACDGLEVQVFNLRRR